MENDTKPLVTIGIPTYNRASAFLKRALTSAVNQTYQNIEIVVSDNASTDHTEDVVKGFADPRISYFKQKENIGAINNFNFCLAQAQGDYLLLLLDDDLVDDDFVETYIQAIDPDRRRTLRLQQHHSLHGQSPGGLCMAVCRRPAAAPGVRHGF